MGDQQVGRVAERSDRQPNGEQERAQRGVRALASGAQGMPVCRRGAMISSTTGAALFRDRRTGECSSFSGRQGLRAGELADRFARRGDRCGFLLVAHGETFGADEADLHYANEAE